MNSFLEFLSPGSAYERCVGTGPRVQDPKTSGITRCSILVYEDPALGKSESTRIGVHTGSYTMGRRGHACRSRWVSSLP